MTQKQEFLRRGLLAKIHTHDFCKQGKAYGMWDEYLFNAYGVRSCAELSIDELYNLIDVMQGKTYAIISGVRPRKKSNPKKSAADKADKTDKRLTEKQEAYLCKLWKLEPDKRGLTAVSKELAEFSLRTLGFRFLYIQNLTSVQANRLITGSEYLFGIKEHKKTKKEQ
jgi:hypothetical protein